MCDFGISGTIAGVTAGVTAGTTGAAAAGTAAGVGAGVAAGTAGATTGLSLTGIGTALSTGFSSLGTSISSGIGSALAAITGETVGGITGATTGAMSAELASLLGVTTSVAEAGALATTGTTAGSVGGTLIGAGQVGMGLAEYGSLASTLLSLGAGGASAGVNAKQAKEQGALIKQQAKLETQNAIAQANTEAQGAAQQNFELAVAGIAGRGQAYSSGLSEKSVRALGRAVNFQVGTDRATVAKNQDIANQIATARLRGIKVNEASAKLQVGDPSTIAGVGAVSALAGGLNAGAGAYRAFSNFRIPTDEVPNLAFV